MTCIQSKGHTPFYALKVTQDNSLIVCQEQRNLSILKSATIVIALRTFSYTVLSFLSNSDFRFAIYKSDKLQYCPDCVNCNSKGSQHCCIEWTGRRIRKEAKGNSALYIKPVSCSINIVHSFVASDCQVHGFLMLELAFEASKSLIFVFLSCGVYF